jgi:cbb3-type cytochrome c oxidase subunit III
MTTVHGGRRDGGRHGRPRRGRVATRTLRLLPGAALVAVVLVAATGRRPDDGRDVDGTVRPRIAADTITPQMIALGERIFQGRVGGALCTTCHGKDAKGVKGLGPDLTDSTWLHGDGGMEFLKTTIRTGVMQPKQGGGVMPPFGGTPLRPEQVEAVAAYVYSLSHD